MRKMLGAWRVNGTLRPTYNNRSAGGGYTAPLVRRLVSALATLACAGALAVAGCGGDDPGNPLSTGLSYLPKDAPFAVALDTNISGSQYKALDQILGKFPFGDQLKAQIVDSIEEGGTSFEQDVRPMLGNPIVVGGPSAKALTANEGSDEEFIAAVQVKDQEKLDSLLESEKAKERGERAGATLYNAGDDNEWLAVEEDVLLAASSRSLLEDAVDRRDGDDHLTEEDFDKGLAGLPKSALARVYVDVRGLLESDPDTADARRVKWVKALTTLGMTAVAKDDAIDVDFNLATDGDLTDADLPIAGGDNAPGVLERPGEIGLGVRDLGQIVKFGEAAGQAVDPTGFGQYSAARRQLEQQLNVNVDEDLLAQLKGDTAMSFSVNGKYGVRAELEDPAAFKRTLAKVADVLPRFAEGAGAGNLALAKPRRGSDFYALADQSGNSVVFGVVDDVFVLANEPVRAGRLASESPVQVEGAKGSVAMGADAEQVARAAITQVGESQPGLGGLLGAGLFTRPLSDLTGSMSASPDGLRGSFELSVD
jgi:hypothetical protein